MQREHGSAGGNGAKSEDSSRGRERNGGNGQAMNRGKPVHGEHGGTSKGVSKAKSSLRARLRQALSKLRLVRARSNGASGGKSNGVLQPVLSESEVIGFKEMLIEKRRQILGDVGQIEGEVLRKNRAEATGDLSMMPIHMADIGSDNYEQELALDLIANEREIIREIDDALKRIESGTFGICEGTGKAISKARLEAKPWARYCIEYRRSEEEKRRRG